MRKIRLTESQFNRLVAKCVKKALNEGAVFSANQIRCIEPSQCEYFNYKKIADILKSKVLDKINIKELQMLDDDAKKTTAKDLVTTLFGEEWNVEDSIEIASVIYSELVKYSGASKMMGFSKGRNIR